MMKKFWTCAVICALVAPLTACSGGPSPAVGNPNYFSARADKRSGTFTGAYNPSGYSAVQVRRLLAQTCSGGRVSGYSEAQQDTLMGFSATCSGGIAPRYALVTFEKLGSGKVLLEATGSDGAGNIVFTQRETTAGSGGPRASAPRTSQPAPQAAAAAPEAATPRPPRAQECKNSITIYCKDPVSGRIIPNKTPG